MKIQNIVFSSILSLAAGIALIVANKSIYATGIIVAAGIIFIIAGIINALIFSNERSKGALASGIGIFTSVGAAILGVCLIIFKSTFVALVPYVFGIIVALAACYEFYILAVGARPASLPGWLYIIGVILIGIAVYIFMQKPQSDVDDHRVMLATGIGLVFFGIFGLIESSMLPHYRKKVLKMQENPTPTDLDPTTEAAEPLPEHTAASSEESETDNKGNDEKK